MEDDHNFHLFLEKNEKNEKCLELLDLATKLIKKIFWKSPPQDMCAEKFPLMSMGGRADRQACADG